MNDFFAPALPAESILSDRLRVHAVQGDGMFPLLRANWDYVLVAPVHAYRGEGIYLIANGAGEELYRVSPAWDGKKGLKLSRENERYQDHVVSIEQFEAGVLAIVVADIKVRDERFLREAA
ncbi:hypothetical protein GOA89_14780 [Sinorhizobium meliloti]|nr:hypothetical protein [Sinorhizobium meliloti]MDW9847561.1 hypothetical protein [Sinorhizobium meliloti]MDX0144056.1 hypothetical protein [Sinorhizobium meliloti]MDX0150481.1 hypothetical protein [Sinorhizobium meliloti]MDX0169739.1 hypothetical protein [Sinorhizobium meliloti]